MKLLKFLLAILLVGVFVILYGKYNLKVSYKYEVDLMETNIETDTISQTAKNERQHQVDTRRREIVNQQQQLNILFWIILSGLVVTSLALLINNLRVRR